MATKQTLPKTQLCALLLKQIQAVKGCESVSEVRAFKLSEPDRDTGANWSIAGFNPGTADIEHVFHALRPVSRRFQLTVDIGD